MQQEDPRFELGFLSPFIWSLAADTAPYNRDWEILTHDVNIALLNEWRSWSPKGQVLEVGPIKNRLLAKCISGFQGAIIMARFGMILESKSLSRGVFEAAFWIQYFVVDPDQALSDFESSEYSSLSEQCEAMAKVVSKEISDKYAEAGQKWKAMTRAKNPLGPKSVHKKSSLDNAYYAYYKHLCAVAAHASISSLESYLDTSGESVGHILAADFEDSNKAYFFAIHAGLLALAVYANPHASDVFQQKWIALMSRLEKLSEEITPF